ncbi:hypothetical protein [uncultured Marivirga sp.]|uniref:hypothetical protein n=1 Tax=uncultured Marivirga sp. TaxID=1123707 RepID=UPI0030ECDEF4|tara:strand:+ start:930 stop:1424 length:495 start_codon:yes stop_codon:yes gene_type:complete
MKILLLFFLTLPLQALGQEEDCIFDQETQTDEFIRDIQEFQNYEWNDSTKEATIILESGDTLIAYRGGCYHFGISGTLKTADQELRETSKDYILEKGLWMAKNLFTTFNFNELQNKVTTEDYEIIRSDEEIFHIEFNHDYYSEYYLRAEQLDGQLKVEIGYYYG